MLLHLEWSRLTGFFVFLLVSIIVLNAKSGYAIDTKNVKIEAGLAAIKIRGTVTDEKGLPLPGVTVKVKGTQLVTVTNIKGAFNIQVGDKTSVLLFSYIGFISKEVVVGNNSTLNVVLNEAKTSLNEVVVIGYGSVRKRDLTGSVSSVPMEDLQKAPVKSFDEALSGRVAGVAVSGNDGQPGRNSSIVIRGQNSLTQDNSPLYVIDGFPLESSNNNSVNPSDIQSIEILKDASATAIYGARGANGVILITTKSGKVGDPVLSYTGSFGFQQNPKKIDLMSPYEFVKLQHEIDTAKASQFYFKEGRDLDYYRNVKGIDWQDQIYRTAPTQEHNLSLSGGTNKTRYFFSTSLTSQVWVILKIGFYSYQVRLNLTLTINKNLR